MGFTSSGDAGGDMERYRSICEEESCDILKRCGPTGPSTAFSGLEVSGSWKL